MVVTFAKKAGGGTINVEMYLPPPLFAKCDTYKLPLSVTAVTFTCVFKGTSKAN